MEIQQSAPYAAYIRSLNWTVETLDGSYLFVKHFPLIGSIIKIQRVTRLPKLSLLLPRLVSNRVRMIAIEPDSAITRSALTAWCHQLPRTITVNREYFLPTKTIHVDLTTSIERIFDRFTEAKRRAVRRAQKNHIIITPSTDIQTFINLKKRSVGLFGGITTYGLEKLWPLFAPQHATIHLAYSPVAKQPVAGVLLLFWKHIAYYWMAGAIPEGKKLFAPTLLVWEALQEAKRHGATTFDFVGVWDERQPKKNLAWKGFTKFKEGFGGTPLSYPILW